MGSPSLVERLLESAEELLNLKRGSAAYRRRAVSAAYYAVFHALAKLGAEALLPSSRRSDDAYGRVYRALEHGALKNVFAQAPLKDHAVFKAIGPLIVSLQTERHRADYSPPSKDLFSPADVEELINKAREIVKRLDNLPEADRCMLATCLLFKERKP
nr:hypothetical protein [uncultured Gellertiella sp.]